MPTRPTNTLDRRRGGFTLVELLAVIFIIGILVSLTVAVGFWLTRQVPEEATRANQKIVMAAVNSYYEVHEAYPTDSKWMEQLQLEPNAREKIQQLPEDAWVPGTQNVKDGWGKSMRYRRNEGLGNRPVVISAGPDGEFSNADDIRSDRE